MDFLTETVSINLVSAAIKSISEWGRLEAVIEVEQNTKAVMPCRAIIATRQITPSAIPPLNFHLAVS